jgi:tetratricopeptide (TPR) repeat protein
LYPPSALSDEQRTLVLRRYRRQADDARKAGDLASAATNLQIMTLLAPGDDTLVRELSAARSAIATGAKELVQAGNTALAAGDLDQANTAMLRALALDPQNPEAAKVLREIDRRRLTRIQADRAARVKQDEMPMRGPRTASAAAAATEGNGESFDLEQALELLRAGDSAGGLRDLRAYVDANPGNRTARQRISGAVADRARELERQGAREQALALYEQAVALRGDANAPWAAQIAPLRQAVSKDYMDKAARMYRVDLAQTIQLLETSLKVDPSNASAAARLKDAKLAQEKLKRIEAAGTGKRP